MKLTRQLDNPRVATTINTMVYIGTLASIDVNEADLDAELASNLAGTYHSFQDLELVDLTSIDNNNDSAIFDDETNYGNDHVQYTVAGNFHDEQVDSTITYSAQVIEDDGTIHDIDVVVVQMQNGDTFVGDMQNLGNMDNLTIRSIELISPITTAAAGYNTWQSMSGSTVCLAQGTFVETPTGPQRVEKLSAGDLILTLDHGAQVLRWIGCITGEIAPPIVFRKGTLGCGLPRKRLALSPNHRVMINARSNTLRFGTVVFLTAAKKLTGLRGVYQSNDSVVAYYHLAFDRHELVFACGGPVESFYPGPEAMKSLPPTAKAAIREIWPGIALGKYPDMVRHEPSGADLRCLIADMAGVSQSAG
ncbi:Hint domain-containing protein [Primorskyibacter sp. 2E233]|uniref:Hint domain-containing protein n=1 Tax=Primorskyibacter sp. 2E233 TaxID=3413431 RepID=UPI003BF22FB4